MIPIILITHGSFGQELLRTAQDIVGRQEQVAALSVTPEMGVDNLSAALDHAVGALDVRAGLLILVDMLGGTPCNTAMMKTRNLPAEIVTGVNLYMVISAFTHRAEMDLAALTAKVSDDGRKAIALPKALLAKRANAG